MMQQFNSGTVEEQRIKALIIQYDDAIRHQRRLMDCNLAEALLSEIPICMNNGEMLDTQLQEKINECERLKMFVETARERVAKLYAEHEENTEIKKFLDFAVFLSTFCDNEDFSATSNSEKEKLFQNFGVSLDKNFVEELHKRDEHELNGGRLQFDKITDKDKRSKLPLNVINEDILALNSKLNAEKLQRKQLECERDNLRDFSEKLCCLLFKYQKRIDTLAETKKKSSETSCVNDHSNKENVCDSSSFTKRNTLQTCIKYNLDKRIRKPIHVTKLAKNVRGIEKSDDSPNVSNISHETTEDKILSKHFPCDICNRNYSKKCCLEKHIRHVHNKEKRHKCPVCAKRFTGKGNLKRHILEHGSEKPFECSKTKKNCNFVEKGAKSPIKLDKRIRKPIHVTKLAKNVRGIEKSDDSPNVSNISHETTEYKILSKHFPCDICNRTYSRKYSLQKHIRHVHYKEKQHKCPVCAKQFTEKGNLKRHTLLHGSKQLFECSICHKKFNDPTGERRHRRIIHEGYTPFQCAHCNKGFGLKAALISHIHSRHFSGYQKQFKCAICDKSFVFNYVLKRHKLTHES